ncbi:MAG: hypothetical protein JNK02_10030 [Planctomycetes bacterium]|nr:hypothetical protein [Planctomycetota bacterium]
MPDATISTVSFAQIRRDARIIAERAAHVGVLTKEITDLAAAFVQPPASRLPHGVAAEHVPDFLLMLATLRFGSGYEPKLRLAPGMTAAGALEAALVARCAEQGLPAPREMAAATLADVARLRGIGVEDGPQAEFAELQLRALRDLGRFLLERPDAAVERLIASAEGSAVRLVETLATMPFFHDVQRYRGMDAHFFHRGQRFVLDVAAACDGRGAGRFDDQHELAPSSDAECALALRAAGVLVFDDPLKDRVDSGEIVPAHSEREVEIRAATVHAADRLLTAVQARLPEATAADVDRWLRLRAADARRAGREPHRTRSVHY